MGILDYPFCFGALYRCALPQFFNGGANSLSRKLKFLKK
jgi:hypothetical protein